ncbi:uncharacterized protein LOC142336725 [Convolutriloba macropyga]|uniref:uncharacterized protein LOC142336725 n=1 Tax=Convolutriloba macropyga TaxID=536237 RepID=UPI003F523887
MSGQCRLRKPEFDHKKPGGILTEEETLEQIQNQLGKTCDWGQDAANTIAGLQNLMEIIRAGPDPTFAGSSAATGVAQNSKCHYPRFYVNHRLFRQHILPYVLTCDDHKDCTGRSSLTFFANSPASNWLWTCLNRKCQITNCKERNVVAEEKVRTAIKKYVKHVCNWDRSLTSMNDVETITVEYFAIRYFGDNEIPLSFLQEFLANNRINENDKQGWMLQLVPNDRS